jgi:predicted SnoaL-like aldol condensation-catalyzing enzyme
MHLHATAREVPPRTSPIAQAPEPPTSLDAELDPAATEASESLVRRYFEMWNSGDGSVADAVLGPTYLDHALPDVLGPAASRSLVPRFHAANPEVRTSIEVTRADAEFVAVRSTTRRAEKGGEVVTVGGALFRVAGGKLVEQWSW